MQQRPAKLLFQRIECDAVADHQKRPDGLGLKLVDHLKAALNRLRIALSAWERPVDMLRSNRIQLFCRVPHVLAIVALA